MGDGRSCPCAGCTVHGWGSSGWKSWKAGITESSQALRLANDRLRGRSADSVLYAPMCLRLCGWVSSLEAGSLSVGSGETRANPLATDRAVNRLAFHCHWVEIGYIRSCTKAQDENAGLSFVEKLLRISR